MKRSAVGFAGTVLILFSSLVCVRVAADRPATQLAQPLASIPTTLGLWTGTDSSELDAQAFGVLGASSYLARIYRSGGASLDLFVAYYDQQRAGESMHSPKNCLPGSGWEVMGASTVEVPDGGTVQRINQYVVQKGSQRVTVLYWYQNKERVHASEYLGKIFLVWDAITRRDTAGSIVRITLPEHPQALEHGIGFASRIIPLMRACLNDEAVDRGQRASAWTAGM